jgi:hypothetical protein
MATLIAKSIKINLLTINVASVAVLHYSSVSDPITFVILVIERHGK